MKNLQYRQVDISLKNEYDKRIPTHMILNLKSKAFAEYEKYVLCSICRYVVNTNTCFICSHCKLPFSQYCFNLFSQSEASIKYETPCSLNNCQSAERNTMKSELHNYKNFFDNLKMKCQYSRECRKQLTYFEFIEGHSDCEYQQVKCNYCQTLLPQIHTNMHSLICYYDQHWQCPVCNESFKDKEYQKHKQHSTCFQNQSIIFQSKSIQSVKSKIDEEFIGQINDKNDEDYKELEDASLGKFQQPNKRRKLNDDCQLEESKSFQKQVIKECQNCKKIFNFKTSKNPQLCNNCFNEREFYRTQLGISNDVVIKEEKQELERLREENKELKETISRISNQESLDNSSQNNVDHRSNPRKFGSQRDSLITAQSSLLCNFCQSAEGSQIIICEECCQGRLRQDDEEMIRFTPFACNKQRCGYLLKVHVSCYCDSNVQHNEDNINDKTQTYNDNQDSIQSE